MRYVLALLLACICLTVRAHANEPAAGAFNVFAASHAEPRADLPRSAFEVFAGPPAIVDIEPKTFNVFRRHVLVYLAPNARSCAPCLAFKRECEQCDNLDFEIRTPPSWIRAYPTMHWQTADGAWKQYSRWTGPSQFDALLQSADERTKHGKMPEKQAHSGW